ncbi:hydroxyquinol 1,2-dioxygenase [Massilia dura]|uniref:Hydroxyquinol 1,2-dioxygenase n=1 Tax=Pseudoduganella dura TaxID=321982 RepID=A0A6I3XF42_9BURK|nr:intradiol ring-cleavage dioxygenase [Pseudoduganella dura]MUI11348.1 hydroxyquinol 1,2-dioxygenase [Pseudoduganella dura]GGX95571.1 6-chlorohydroxyquinol-1,2-dioxygenase [Pseudoduganella dura]
MRNFNEENITDAVLGRVSGSPDPRTRAISGALVRHLHAFIREIEPTQEEWEWAIDFLTATGRMCSATRQEFILLSDVLGVSMLVDALNHRVPEGATETTVLGPFYVNDPPELPNGSAVFAAVAGETPLLVEGTVRDTDGRPVAEASVDVWLADEEGYYDVQLSADRYTGRGRFRTDSEGNFSLQATVPSPYPIPDDGPVGDMLKAQGRHPYRPAHVHFRIAALGCKTLVTHLFLEGDPYLDSDVVFGVKDSLVERLIDLPAAAEASRLRDGSPQLALRRNFVLAKDTSA